MVSWRDAVVRPEATVIEVLSVLDQSAQQIALVVDEEYRLLGTVTDGDIRRALLRGGRLNDDVSSIMQKEFVFARAGDSREKALAVMRNKLFHQLPILDESHRLVGLYTIDEILVSGQRSNPVVIMAGGEGKRLQPLTEKCPKPMLQVGGKPVLETILNNFIDQGFSRFYMSVHYKSEVIREYFGDGSHWGVEINYINESRPLGTAGALSMLPGDVHESVIVINGDILTKINYGQLLGFHERYGSNATMCVRMYQDMIPYGVVTMENSRLLKIEEKPVRQCYVNAGIYVLNKNALEMIPMNTFFNMPDVFERLIREGKCVTAYPIEEYWIDIGRINDYEQANGDFERIFR